MGQKRGLAHQKSTNKQSALRKTPKRVFFRRTQMRGKRSVHHRGKKKRRERRHRESKTSVWTKRTCGRSLRGNGHKGKLLRVQQLRGGRVHRHAVIVPHAGLQTLQGGLEYGPCSSELCEERRKNKRKQNRVPAHTVPLWLAVPTVGGHGGVAGPVILPRQGTPLHLRFGVEQLICSSGWQEKGATTRKQNRRTQEARPGAAGGSAVQVT